MASTHLFVVHAGHFARPSSLLSRGYRGAVGVVIYGTATGAAAASAAMRLLTIVMHSVTIPESSRGLATMSMGGQVI